MKRWPRPLAATAEDEFDLRECAGVESVRTAHRKEHWLGRPIHRRDTRRSLPCILPSRDQPANAHPLPHATVGVDREANCFHRRSAGMSDRLPDKDRSARSSSEDLSRCQNLFSMQPRISVPVCRKKVGGTPSACKVSLQAASGFSELIHQNSEPVCFASRSFRSNNMTRRPVSSGRMNLRLERL